MIKNYTKDKCEHLQKVQEIGFKVLELFLNPMYYKYPENILKYFKALYNPKIYDFTDMFVLALKVKDMAIIKEIIAKDNTGTIICLINEMNEVRACNELKCIEDIINHVFVNTYYSIDMLKCLLKFDININEKNKALEKNVVYDRIQEVELLIKNGANVNYRNDNHQTPLFHARKNLSMVKLLIKYGADVNIIDNLGRTLLFTFKNFDSPEIIEYLIQHGANVNAKNINGLTILQELVKYSKNTDLLNIVSKWIKHGVDVNIEDANGETLLFDTIIRGDIKILKLLLDTTNIDINKKNNKGQTPLDKAILIKNFEIIKLLLNTKNINITAQNKQQITELAEKAKKFLI